jgi:hypothetical protein
MAISPPPEREGASNAFNGAFAMAITQGDDFSEVSVSLARRSLRKGTRRDDQKSMPSHQRFKLARGTVRGHSHDPRQQQHRTYVSSIGRPSGPT